jgi:hypothetical protein
MVGGADAEPLISPGIKRLGVNKKLYSWRHCF